MRVYIGLDNGNSHLGMFDLDCRSWTPKIEHSILIIHVGLIVFKITKRTVYMTMVAYLNVTDRQTNIHH